MGLGTIRGLGRLLFLSHGCLLPEPEEDGNLRDVSVGGEAIASLAMHDPKRFFSAFPLIHGKNLDSTPSLNFIAYNHAIQGKK